MVFWFRFVLLVVLLTAACSSPASTIEIPQSTADPTADPASVSSPTPEQTPTLPASPTAEIVPPTLTPLPTGPAETPTADATFTPPPSPTVDPNATATLSAPLPIGVIEQPPYQASECSDKYPCNEDVAGWEARIRVPEGFVASYFGRIDGQPTAITFGPEGDLYIAAMDGTIYRMDASGEAAVYVDGFRVPTGLAFQPGTEKLFVSNRVLDQNVDGESQVSVVENGRVRSLITGLPCCYTSYHAANGIAFGPDGYGYVAVGGRADHGEILEGPNKGEQDELHPLEASILRFSPDGREVEPYARGFRNAYDIAWDADGQLYATNNGPDFGPPEDFYKVVPGGEHGYPWYDCDACFPAPAGVELVPPIHNFPPHSSPTGVTAYLSSQFPGYYNSLFVTLWSAFPGAQKVVWFAPGGRDATDFATGFAAPIDVTVGPEGSLYVADWATGIIFRIEYQMSIDN